jgi:hypothetical protein
MARRTTLAVLLGLLLLAIGHTQRAEAQGNEILQLVNAVRAEYGLAPVAYNAQLATAAQNHANFIATRMPFTATYGVNGSTWQDRAQAAGYPGYAGENLVGGTRLDPAARRHLVAKQRQPLQQHAESALDRGRRGLCRRQRAKLLRHGLWHAQRRPAAPRPSSRSLTFRSSLRRSSWPQPNEDGSIIHARRCEGHTFWAIAARYEVSASRPLPVQRDERGQRIESWRQAHHPSGGWTAPATDPHSADGPSHRARRRIAVGHRRLLQARI